MNIKPFFPVFIVLIGVVIYAYHAPERKPERATTFTPKQYIEQVEKNKAEKRSVETEQETADQAVTTPDSDN